jgi:asparagine synthase (glutamine-hydrolysing)
VSGLLVAFGDLAAAPWSLMLSDLDLLGGDGCASWSDRGREIALARAYHHELGSEPETPIVHHAGCTIVLDGRLAPGSGASDGSDSKRIVDAYLRWGDECGAHLEGDFAFALWDARDSSLHCACDTLGSRTMALHWDGRHFLACTRAVTLLRHPRVPHRLDASYAAHVLCSLESLLPGTTALASVRRLRPGRCVAVNSARMRERATHPLRLDRRTHYGNPNEAYEEFWSLLDTSVRLATRGARQPCVSLSGGLDSACVASATATVVGVTDAFSILPASAGYLDDRRALEALLRRYPGTWHPLEPERERIFAEHAEGPVLDDPRPMAGPLMPSRSQLWKAMAVAGYDVALDGEGGDELFDLSVTPGDLSRVGAWTTGLRYTARCAAPSAAAMRWFVVPRLGPRLRRAWLQRRGCRVPAWVAPALRDRAETRAVLRTDSETLRLTTWADRFPLALESVTAVAFRQAVRLLSAGPSASPRSPLFNRAIAEMVAQAPAAAVLSPGHSKAFLRQASAGRLPDEIRWRPKRERLYDELLRATLASPVAGRLVESVRVGPLGEWVEAASVRGVVGEAAATASAPVAEQAHAVLCFAGWVDRVEREYGRLSLG